MCSLVQRKLCRLIMRVRNARRTVKPLYTGRASLPASVHLHQNYQRRPLLTDQCSELQVCSSCTNQIDVFTPDSGQQSALNILMLL